MYGPEPKPANDPTRITRARALRRNSTMPERVLWNLLRNRRCGGLKFRRQHPIGQVTADFYCEEARLVVELDSDWHDGRAAEDLARDRSLAAKGIATLRISVSDLMRSPEWITTRIASAAAMRIDELSRAQDPGGE